MLIGITGKKGVGKDTLADILMEEYKHVLHKRYSLATPLKKLVGKFVYGDEDRLFHDADAKNAVLPSEVRQALINDNIVTVRHLLQYIGTDLLKEGISKDFFIRCIPNKYRVMTIITDIRFKEEADFIHKVDGIIIHIDRDTGYIDDHASEQLAGITPDFIIDNNGSIEDLVQVVRGAAIKGRDGEPHFKQLIDAFIQRHTGNIKITSDDKGRGISKD